MDGTKHFSVAGENAKVIRISRETESKTFLAKTAYSLNTSLNNSHDNQTDDGGGSCVLPLKPALSTCIKTCHNLGNYYI